MSLADRSAPPATWRRDRKLERNQMLLRDVNTQIRSLSMDGSVAELSLICECSNDQCRAKIIVPVEEYEFVRGRSDRLLIAPGHEDEDLQPIGEYHGYVVAVRKSTR